MDARKLQVKFFLSAPAEPKLDQVVVVFHDWIRKKALDELLIDVANYEHVHDGPGILLVGHTSDYFVDLDQGRPGLLYSRKRDADADPARRVEDAFRRALTACAKLESEAELSPAFRFSGGEAVFRLTDRLNASNDDATLNAVRPFLEATLAKLYAGTAYTIAREGTERELFTARIKAEGAPGVRDLLARLS